MPTNFLNFGPELDRIDTNVKSILKAGPSDILAAIAALSAKLDSQAQLILSEESELKKLVEQILAWGIPPVPENPPVSAEAFYRPPAFVRGKLVMDFDLKNDWVLGPIAIVFKDAQGSVVPAPDGAAFSSTVSDPTMLNVVDNDGLHFTVNALVRAGTVTITHHEANGLVPDFMDNVNIVEDLTPTAADSDIADAAHTMQPVPAA